MFLNGFKKNGSVSNGKKLAYKTVLKHLIMEE